MPAGVPAYTALANMTLSSSASAVNFTSINQGYRDLVLVVDNAREATSNGASFLMRLNANTGSLYNIVTMVGEGGSAQSTTSVTQFEFPLTLGTGMSTTIPLNLIINVLDYSASDKHKPILVRFNHPGGNVTAANHGRFAANTAITQVNLFPFTGSFASNTTFALYGVSS